MLRNFLRSKIHRALVTEADLNYIGSLAIDEELMKISEIEENEVIQIANITNGERLVTYAIRAPWGSRTICANGAAAHKVRVGDLIIIFAFGMYTENEILACQPKIILLDEANNPIAEPRQEMYARNG